MPKSREIDRSSQGDIDQLNKQKQQLLNDSAILAKEANETERSLCGQLMLVNTVLVTGLIIAITNKNLIGGISGIVKTLIFIAFVFLLFSTVCGIVYYFEIINHFYKSTKSKYEAAKVALDEKILSFEELNRTIRELEEKVPEKTDTTWLKFQIASLGVGTILFLISLFIILFFESCS